MIDVPLGNMHDTGKDPQANLHASTQPPSSESWLSTKQDDAIGYVDCLPHLGSECTDVDCQSLGLTSECTDQCVVVACDDAEHIEKHLNCSDCGVEEEPCDLTDCHWSGEEGMSGPVHECCTDFHAYLPETRALGYDASKSALNWDQQMQEFLCGCDHQPLLTNTASVDFDMASVIGAPSHFQDTNSMMALAQDSHSQLNNTASFNIPQPVHTIDNAYHCMWDQCTQRFQSLEELASHVNLAHLQSIGLGHGFSVQPNSIGGCHWDNCSAFPSMDSIPGPSKGDTINFMLSVLAHHLMHDHLGFPSRSSSVTLESSSSASGDEMQKDLTHVFMDTLPPSNSVTDYSGLERGNTAEPDIHLCRWEGCAAIFPSQAELSAHLSEAHVGCGKARYDCRWDQCQRFGEKGFSSKQKILRHLQTHTGHRPFECKVCHLHFSEAATLQQHMRRHTRERPYVCDHPGCGKSFAIAGALTVHKRTHNGEKPFVCPHCSKTFSESSNLSKHIRTHTGERPYTCAEPGCGRSFARPDQLSRHMNVHRGSTRTKGVKQELMSAAIL